MRTNQLSQDERSSRAQTAIEGLPHGGRDAIRLRVQCARSHHVATVYDTAVGLVYAAPVRARAHGDGDLPDEPHGDHEPRRWFDLLDAGSGAAVDDALPAWCDCGPRTLSRAAILAWVVEGDHRVVID